MEDIYVKKYWEEEGVLFYLHFRGHQAVRQIEIIDGEVKKMNLDNPVVGDSMLYDQSFEDLDLVQTDFISEKEFEVIWVS